MEEETGGWAYHNLIHVQNVANLVEQLLQGLTIDETFKEEAQIAAILHDIGSLEGKAGHPIRSYEYANQYFQTHRLNLVHENLVLDAIKCHSDGFETNNLMALALILADKLDITKQRLAPAGYEVPGLNEIRFIDEIKITFNNQKLCINFITQKSFNQTEFKNFYFAKKVFKAIKSFSKKLNLTYEVSLNNEAWSIE